MSYTSSGTNPIRDRKSVVNRRDYENFPDTSDFNPTGENEDDQSEESSDEIEKLNKIVGEYGQNAFQRRTRTIIPSNYQEGGIYQSNNNQEERTQSEFFANQSNDDLLKGEAQSADNYETMMDSFLQQNLKPNVTQNLYQRRSTVAKYNPKILQKQREEARMSLEMDSEKFEDQMAQFAQQDKNKRQVILKSPKPGKIIEIPDEQIPTQGHVSEESSEEEKGDQPKIEVEKSNEIDSSYEEDSQGDSFKQELLKHMDEPTMDNKEPSPRKKQNKNKLPTEEDEFSSIDKIKTIDINERRHQDIAKESLKKHSVLQGQHINAEEEHQQKILSDLKCLKTISNVIRQEEQLNAIKPTCVGMTDLLYLYGNSDGSVRMFGKEKEEEYFQFKHKDLIGNAVTCMDVHLLRPDYAIFGYMKGQLVLIDTTNPQKTLKTIKDHHKGVPIVNVKFCDYQGKHSGEEESHDLNTSHHNTTSSRIVKDQEEKQVWMFVSIDEESRVIVNTISKVLFVLNASKQVIVDPLKMTPNTSKYTTLAARFFSKMHPYDDINDSTTIVALANMNSVHILQLQPKNFQNKMMIKKPKSYFSKRQNQYCDIKAYPPAIAWGVGHSPIMKDKGYSLLAVSWGPLIQIVVQLDVANEKLPFFQDGFYVLQEYDKMIPIQLKKASQKTNEDGDYEEEEDVFENDMENSFNQKNLFIESMHFLSESTLLVLTHGMELRILHTEHFYLQDFITDQENQLKTIQEGKVPEPVEIRKPELQKQQFDKTLKPSMFGVKYTQSLKFFQDLGIALSETKLFTFQHKSWHQSLIEYKNQAEGNWIKVFARALDFYRGNIKGYQGVAEDQELRENILKAGLKLMIRDFIQEAIDKQRNMISDKIIFNSPAQPFQCDTSSFLDESSADIRESLRMLDANPAKDDDRQQHFRIFVRIAIEFCVELQDCYFLFYELFLLFRDEKLEDLFVSELESFIMAGKFQEWEIPNDILQNHLINYYKEQSKPEILEKIIINLNFKQCPKKCVLQLIHYAEQHFLSTAILFLYTSVFERKDVIQIQLNFYFQNSSCVQVLFSLCDLYRKADKNNHGSFEKIKLLAQNKLIEQERIQVEKSSTYLGYKLFWVIRLFITGKKFPQGNIRERKWKVYVHDIIQFIMNREILTLLLEFDAEALFQIISLLFYEGKPCEFVMQGRDPETNKEHLDSINHNQMLKILDEVCKKHSDENITLQYLFFVSNTSSFVNIQQQEPSFYYYIVKELLRYHVKFLDFNHHVLERVMSHKKLYRRMSRNLPKIKIPDEFKHLLKSETDLIELVKKSEPMSESQTQELLKLASATQFKQVIIHLLEKKEDYIQCLQLYLDGMKDNAEWTKNYFAKRAFEWIKEKLLLLENRSSQSQAAKNTYEQFRREVMDNIKQMVLLNVHESISLIDQKFNGIHKEVIDQLSRHPQEQFIYLETLLTVKEDIIQSTIKEYSLHLTNPIEAKKYLGLLKLHLKLCCQLNSDKVMPIIEKIVQHGYYPTEDCLKICLENKQIEACALLNKKLGKYYESVQLFIDVLKDKINPVDLKNEIKFALHNHIDTKFCIQNETQLSQCTYFDKIFKKIMNICKKKHGDVDLDKEEQIWYLVLDMLFDFKQNEQLKHKKYCNQFFLSRITLFSEELLRHVKFQNFINHLITKYNSLKYKVMKDLIQNVFNDTRGEQIVLYNANHAIHITNSSMFKSFQDMQSSGILFRSLKCFHCRRYLDMQLEEKYGMHAQNQQDEDMLYDPFNEQIRIFQCSHTFHMGCILKTCNLSQEDIEKNKDERMRCPKCYSQNFDIENDNGSPIRPRIRGTLQAQKSLTVQQCEQPQTTNKKQTTELKRSQTIVNREIMKLSKRMENFDSNMEHEGLTSKNFKMRPTF